MADVMHGALTDPVTYAIPAFIAFMVLESISLRFVNDLPDDPSERPFLGYEPKDTRTNILMGLVSLFVTGASRFAALFGYAALYAITPLRLDPHRWHTWVGAFLAVDLLFYLYHRAGHRVRIMWAAHQAHHNSRRFNLSTAVRQKWNPWFELLYWTPLPLLGLPPWMIFTTFSVNLIYQFWVHTERIDKLPAPIEFVFNTPSHHRVHHGSDPDYLDKNYAGMLIIWDRLFGTFTPETHRPTYGLTKNVYSYNLLTLQYHEYGAIWRDVRSGRSWRERLGYVFAPPGWEPATVAADALA